MAEDVVGDARDHAVATVSLEARPDTAISERRGIALPRGDASADQRGPDGEQSDAEQQHGPAPLAKAVGPTRSKRARRQRRSRLASAIRNPTRRHSTPFMAHAPGVYTAGRRAGGAPHRAAVRPVPVGRARRRSVEAGGRSGRARLAARVARAGAVRRARRAHGVPPRDRRIGVVARGADAGDAGGGDRHDRAAARRVGHRQGGRRAFPPPRVGARRRPVHRAQLRGAAGAAARGGAVRLRARRVHRRDAEQARAARAGRRRDAVSRRSRRDGAGGAGQVPAGAAGARVPAARRHARAPHRRAGRRRDQPRPAAARCSRASSARISSTA